MHVIRFIMILWMVPNYACIYYYLNLSFLKVEELQNLFSEDKKTF